MPDFGTFKVECGKLRVTDPCYDIDTHCAGTLHDVKNGTWRAHAGLSVEQSDEGTWVIRNKALYVRHSEFPTAEPSEKMDIDVGVDSGQAGFFDAEYFNENQGGEYGDLSTFYGQCCQLTLGSDDKGGVLEFGACCSSGLGGGSYECYVTRHPLTNEIVAASIVFIPDEEPEEDTEEPEEMDD